MSVANQYSSAELGAKGDYLRPELNQPWQNFIMKFLSLLVSQKKENKNNKVNKIPFLAARDPRQTPLDPFKA